MIRSFVAFVALVVLSSGRQGFVPSSLRAIVGQSLQVSIPGKDRVAVLIADMEGEHEARPHGVPASVDWSAGPRVGMGNDSRGWQAFVPWGQVYEAETGHPAANARVHIRRLRAWRLGPEGRWHRLTGEGKLEGAAFREDFAGNESVPADVRREPEGGISVRLGTGRNFHFWADDRQAIDPTAIHGIVVTFEARLVLHDPSTPDDLDRARLVAGAGGDYWATLDAQWDDWRTNGDFAIGKLKLVTREWRLFSARSVPAAVLRRNPPPTN
jgi:hypothetical protein